MRFRALALCVVALLVAVALWSLDYEVLGLTSSQPDTHEERHGAAPRKSDGVVDDRAVGSLSRDPLPVPPSHASAGLGESGSLRRKRGTRPRLRAFPFCCFRPWRAIAP